jgi:hypothetical protein
VPALAARPAHLPCRPTGRGVQPRALARGSTGPNRPAALLNGRASWPAAPACSSAQARSPCLGLLAAPVLACHAARAHTGPNRLAACSPNRSARGFQEPAIRVETLTPLPVSNRPAAVSCNRRRHVDPRRLRSMSSAGGSANAPARSAVPPPGSSGPVA